MKKGRFKNGLESVRNRTTSTKKISKGLPKNEKRLWSGRVAHQNEKPTILKGR